MNYYPRNVGDYCAATAHLTDLEDLFYTRLLDRYYLTEAPLPLDIEKTCKLVRARSKEQRAAVEAVLDEFFTRCDDGYRQRRCDEEIAEFRAKQERARANGRKSAGRPRQYEDVPRETKPTNNPQETKPVMSGLPNTNQAVTESIGKAEPRTELTNKQNQNQETEKDGSAAEAGECGGGADAPPPRKTEHLGTRLPDDWALTEARRAEASRICAELGISINVEQEANSFVDHWRAAPGKDGRKADWEGTWRNWIRKACQFAAQRGRGGSLARTGSIAQQAAADVQRAQELFGDAR